MGVNRAAIIKTSVFVILPIVLAIAVFFLYRKYLFGSNFINKTVLGQDMEYRYFILDEFDSRASEVDLSNNVDVYYRGTAPYITNSGRDNMQKSTIRMLDDARHIVEVENNDLGKPSIYFGINSGYRTEGRNAEVGGANKSAHKRGFAVDIAWSRYSKEQKDIIREALERVGFNRFGISSSFIHVDNDLTLPNPAVWGYK